jgi:hypothetical protein
MLQTVEAVIEKGSQIQFLEPLTFPQTRQRVLVILLNDEYEPLITEVKPVEKKPRLDAKSAVARLRKLSQGIRWKSLDGMSIREAREEGRRY